MKLIEKDLENIKVNLLIKDSDKNTKCIEMNNHEKIAKTCRHMEACGSPRSIRYGRRSVTERERDNRFAVVLVTWRKRRS